MRAVQTPAEPGAAIVLDGVGFRWRKDDALVLDIPRLQIARGERVLIRGPSGSGKSTLLGLIGGVSMPERGGVSVIGQDLGVLRPAARDTFRADHVGFIFQLFNLIAYLSMVDNVLLPCRFSRRRRACVAQAGSDPDQEARRLLARLGLGDLLVAHRRVSELSVGQQQRVAAARALIGRPEVIIADEPTSALDADHRDEFLDLLTQECNAAGITLLFVSHDASLASHFDRTVDLVAVNMAGAPRKRAGDTA